MSVTLHVHPLPSLDAMRSVLEHLLSTPVHVRPHARRAGDILPTAIVAVYRRGDDSLAGAWVSDLPFAAYAGAAMTRFPVSTAEVQIAQGRISDCVAENFRELMNVGAAVFNDVEVRYVRFRGLYQVGVDPVPADASALLAAPAAGLHTAVEIPGYGLGLASLLLVD